VKLGHALEDALRLLGAAGIDDEMMGQSWARAPAPPLSMPPASTALLWQALRLAPAHTPLPAAGVIAKLETELEGMRSQLLDRWHDEEGRIARLKLESMAEFAAGAAHEINTPLAIISGQAQHLLKSEESLERAQALERVMTQAHKIHHLLRDLLLFARPPVPRKRPVAMARLVRKVVKNLANRAVQRQVRVDVVGPRNLTLQGDPGLLEMAVTSLLCNAIEAANTDGWVRVTLKPVRTNRLAVTIEDDGPGLSPAQHKHLFDPFYSGRTAGRGTGLGLSKAWRIAKIHGGVLRGPVEGVQPTRFVLELPLSTPKRRRQPEPSRRIRATARR
jgi:signal transduction histidine kinase